MIADKYEGKLVTLIDLENPENTERLVSIGKGPNEFLNLRYISFYVQKNAWSIYDSSASRVSVYEVKDDQINTNTESLLSSARIDNTRPEDVKPFDNQYIGHGPFKSNQLGLFDKDGQLIQTFGTYPGSKEGIDFSEAFFIKTQGLLAVSPDQKHFVLAGAFNDQLVFYKAAETVPQKVKEYFTADSKLETSSSDGNSRSRKTPEVMEMYRGLYFTSNRLYALYWGMTQKELQVPHNRNCTVLAFDWEGNLLQAYHIPDLLHGGIAVDEKNNCLYGLTFADAGKGEAVLMKYQLYNTPLNPSLFIWLSAK